MSTTIEENIKGEWIIIIAVAALFAFMLWTVGNYQFFTKPQEEQTAPCSTFASEPLNQVPARCVTPQGGFEQ